tara:strand:- start:308 stop:1435 length:1128 start_codon:yes stop_codon:yes gene_type:complete
MANTNFAALDDHSKKVWSRTVWKQAREKMFTSKFMGTSPESLIYRITELTKSEKGTQAVVPLVPDLEGDGITGDNTLEGNEEAMKAVQDTVQIDQLRHAVANTGRITDQKSVVQFRKTGLNQLTYWLADRCDQMAFLTLAGMSYTRHNDGRTRPVNASGGNLGDLSFAGDVTAPSSERYLQVSGDELVSGDNTNLTATDTLGYKHIVKLQALAKTRYMRGIRGNGGSEAYHLFLHPLAMAKLKLDPDFKENARHASVRGSGNSVWKGGDSFVVDGVHIHEFRHVPTTFGAAASSKWGATGTVDGCRALLCGAQALAVVDLGGGYWDEDEFDYNNRGGIAYGKMFGFKKPTFKFAKTSADSSVKQDYGVITIDIAI